MDAECGAMGLCDLRSGHEGRHETSVDRALADTRPGDRQRDFAAALLDAYVPGSGATAGDIATALLAHPLVQPYLATRPTVSPGDDEGHACATCAEHDESLDSAYRKGLADALRAAPGDDLAALRAAVEALPEPSYEDTAYGDVVNRDAVLAALDAAALRVAPDDGDGLREAALEMLTAFTAKPDVDEADHPEGLTKEQVERAWSDWGLRQDAAVDALRAALDPEAGNRSA